MMKLKDKNDTVEELINDSLKELSINFSKTHKISAIFSYWTNPNFLDNDKNICVRGVMDLAIINPTTAKVSGFKYLLDRAIVLRKNEGTIDKPKYGKQQGYEDIRRAMLKEVIAKGVGYLAMYLQDKTKDQIEEFNKLVPENLLDINQVDTEELVVTPELVEEFNKENPDEVRAD